MRRRLPISTIKPLDLLFLLLVVVNSGFALTNGYDRILFLSELGLLAMLVLFRTGLLGLKIRGSVLLMIVALLLAMVANMDFGSVFAYVQMGVVIVVSALMADIYPARRICALFIRVMRFIIVFNMAVAVFQMITGLFPSIAPLIANGAGKRYYSWAIVNYDAIFSTISGRPSGIFWEPGVFSAFIALTALIDLMEHGRDVNRKYLAVYGAAFLICGSTTGYAYLGITAALALSIFSKKKRWLLLGILFAVVAVVFYAEYDNIVDALVRWNPAVFRKLTYSNASLDSRLYSPGVDLTILAGHPFGAGASGYADLYRKVSEAMDVQATSRTSTGTYFGACYGVVFFLTYNYLWLRGLLRCRNLGTAVAKTLAVILFALVITANPLYQNVFLWVFLFAIQREPRSRTEESGFIPGEIREAEL